MAAVLGLDLDAVRAVAAEAAQGEVCEAANDNDPAQVVVSVMADALANVDVKTPSVPVIANVTAQAVSDPEKIKAFLGRYDPSHQSRYRVPCAMPTRLPSLPKQAAAAMGSVDILINNAGITRDNLFMRMSDDEWQSVLDVNLTATFKLCKGVLRGMMKSRWGRIVNISSIVGATGNPGQGNYAASKAGVVGMSKSLAYEVASRGITVNAVAPGFIATAMTDKLTDDQKANINTQIPAARMGTPEEIAAAVLYLASPEAAYVTGSTLHVNGGMAML
ncbi:3-oxoacyl-[acyl-carrier-protein] reductase FabG [Nymphon striatum]|nr:3-oxoacyl-[acyl-carrier-protein] reductase FabG [Nymphon striatum]